MLSAYNSFWGPNCMLSDITMQTIHQHTSQNSTHQKLTVNTVTHYSPIYNHTSQTITQSSFSNCPAYLNHYHFHWNSNSSYHHSIRYIKEISTKKNEIKNKFSFKQLNRFQSNKKYQQKQTKKSCSSFPFDRIDLNKDIIK